MTMSYIIKYHNKTNSIIKGWSKFVNGQFTEEIQQTFTGVY